MEFSFELFTRLNQGTLGSSSAETADRDRRQLAGAESRKFSVKSNDPHPGKFPFPWTEVRK